MSKNTSNSITQRIVGAIVLLALITLIAILLLQPSDRLPNTASKGQRPDLTPSNTTHPERPQTPPVIVLESASGHQGNNMVLPPINISNGVSTDEGTPSAEVVDESIWQQVEQAAPQPPMPSNNRPIAQGLGSSTQSASATNPNSSRTNGSRAEAPNRSNNTNTAQKSEPAKPKLELIASSQTNQNRTPTTTSKNSRAPQTNAKPTAQGTWYVQLGAFGRADNAQKVYNQYKQLGYNVRIQKEKNLHRVQIGPYASKNEAEQIKTRTRNPKDGINPSVIRIP